MGGGESRPGRYPWVVALLDSFGFNFCGGVLISDRDVLTAAHCVHTKKPGDLRLVIGEHDVDVAHLFGRTHKVTAIKVHDKFVHERWTNDLALLRLERPVKVMPICLPTLDTKMYRNLVVAGWGRRATDDLLRPSRLHDVTLPLVGKVACEKAWTRSRVNSDLQVCAGAEGRDTCVYDSGSPLMEVPPGQRSRSVGTTTLIGVTSFGSNKCGEATKPGVYSRVTSYLTWIGGHATLRTCTNVYS